MGCLMLLFMDANIAEGCCISFFFQLLLGNNATNQFTPTIPSATLDLPPDLPFLVQILLIATQQTAPGVLKRPAKASPTSRFQSALDFIVNSFIFFHLEQNVQKKKKGRNQQCAKQQKKGAFALHIVISSSAYVSTET